MYVIEQAKGKTVSLPAKAVSATQIKTMTSKLARQILACLSDKPSYPKEIAKKLRVHEQKVYYHIRKLEKAKLIEITKKKQIGGTQANIYALTEPALVVLLKEFEETQASALAEQTSPQFLEPFIENGQLKATIIVGSPDPHGPEKARSRDGFYGIDFALFLGTFLHHVPQLHVRLDTEIREEELTGNIILIGGPIVNTVTGKINKKLPIRFEREHNWGIYSSLTEKVYHADECGIIVKTKNPFNPKKSCMVIAGKRHQGTRAVMIAFMQHFADINNGNNKNAKIMAKVVEGVDKDADGIVDAVEFLE